MSDNPTYRKSQGDWEPGVWYTVLDPDGGLWCETSDRQDAVNRTRSGDTMYRQWKRVCTESELREVTPTEDELRRAREYRAEVEADREES